ncbi:hypothetical protein BMS3Bbin01_01950 [bacterium BMS3Bbin01]|nr:hypothetical protein BMS3Bbin01_01950 [bacterium BMS3Bbin01]
MGAGGGGDGTDPPADVMDVLGVCVDVEVDVAPPGVQAATTSKNTTMTAMNAVPLPWIPRMSAVCTQR